MSLLISAIAPAGRVNVGQGCNCGPNHTGRAADQECFLGDGVFLGLATAIKFPFNLALAPYTLVATGVTTRGAKVGASPPSLANQLHPGWLLSESMYTLARNDARFQTRQKAREHKWWSDYSIFRLGL
ncbi:hypothetical protein TeGR_g1874, partial [Tetraparma gracilis]